MTIEQRRQRIRQRQTPQTQNSHPLRSPSSACMLLAVTLASWSILVSGWTSTPGNRQMHMLSSSSSYHRQRHTGRLFAASGDGNDENLISEMDARVLQSMLRDNKLDLEQTSNMKKLLERGVRKDKDFEDLDELRNKQDEEKKPEEETYSSQVIKTLADTKFWKAFTRNAGEVFESLAISVSNEIEKGAKVLVGLGFFAWDRAKRDVARALPTAGSAGIPKKQVFQLGDTSSYVEPKANEEEGELTPSQKAKNLRQEFTTPADELSAVTAEISSIFKRVDRQVKNQPVDKSKDMRNPFFAAFVEERDFQASKQQEDESAPFYASSTLSSTASRGSSRLQSAFTRTKKTKLAQEKENPATKANRLAAAAIDSAYQVRKEIESEQNVPGYKTKQLRESTVDVSKRIAGAAKKTAGILGGASTFLLGTRDKDAEPEQQQVPPTMEPKVKADPVDMLDDTAYFAFKRGGLPQEDSPVEDLSSGIIIEDDKVIAPEEPKSGPFGFLSAIAKRDRPKPVEEVQAPKVTPKSKSPKEAANDFVTDAEVVMDNEDKFNYFDADVAGERSSEKFFTTDSYLDSMEAGSFFSQNDADEENLRLVTAEVLMDDDDFDESRFDQATAVNNMSVEELLAEEEEETKEPNFVTKATLRTLDVAFLVVEKGLSVAPSAYEVAKRAATRVNESKLKDSAGSKVGWEFHNGNVRGEKRY